MKVNQTRVELGLRGLKYYPCGVIYLHLLSQWPVTPMKTARVQTRRGQDGLGSTGAAPSLWFC